MKFLKNRRHSVCGINVAALFVFLLVFLFAQEARTSNPLDNFVNSGTVIPEKCSVLIIDLSDGKKLFSHNSEVPLIPASINKVVTIASLLEKSGTDFKYETKVYTTGKVKDGVLEGNLIFVGSGDPSLGADIEPIGSDLIEECIAHLKERKIKRISGGIEIDNSIFEGPSTPPSWQAADLKQSYGTGCHGFNYRRNAVGKSSVANPGMVFTSQLLSALRQAGIEVEENKDATNEGRKMLFTHQSPSIDEIMRSCMMRSDNLYAEAFLRTTALLNGKEGTTEKGANLERKYWEKKNLPLEQVELIDGSGLSRSNRMTADFMGSLLKYMADNVDFVSFFPLAGQEGTLKKFLKDTSLDSYVALKTGSMNGIQCYAGYLLDDEYAPTHAIVVMINGFKNSRDAAKREVEKMLLEIFRPNIE